MLTTSGSMAAVKNFKSSNPDRLAIQTESVNLHPQISIVKIIIKAQTKINLYLILKVTMQIATISATIIAATIKTTATTTIIIIIVTHKALKMLFLIE